MSVDLEGGDLKGAYVYGVVDHFRVHLVGLILRVLTLWVMVLWVLILWGYPMVTASKIWIFWLILKIPQYCPEGQQPKLPQGGQNPPPLLEFCICMLSSFRPPSFPLLRQMSFALTSFPVGIKTCPKGIKVAEINFEFFGEQKFFFTTICWNS